MQVTQTGVIIAPDAVPLLRAEISATGIARLPGFLSPGLVDLLKRQIDVAGFRPKEEIFARSQVVFGATLKMSLQDPIMMALHFMLNRQELFDLASAVGDVSRPGNFVCRMHRTTADSEQHIDWHDDSVDERVLGLDINLSEAPFQGGAFQMRYKAGEVTADVTDWVPGDAFLFRVGGGWRHRLTRVTSGSRTVAVGWFRLTPDWQTIAIAGFRTGKIVLSEWRKDE